MSQEELDAETRIAIIKKEQARMLKEAKKGGKLYDIFKYHINDLDIYPTNETLSKLWKEMEQHFLDSGYDICEDCSKCEDCDKRR
jgi:hypothetical protein